MEKNYKEIIRIIKYYSRVDISVGPLEVYYQDERDIFQRQHLTDTEEILEVDQPFI